MTGYGGVPTSGVAAVLLNVVVLPAAGSYGNISVYPTGLAGGASALSWINGNYGSVLIEIPVSPQVQGQGGQWTGGQVTIANASASNGSTDYAVDVEGYVTNSQTDTSGLINAINPVQPPICDTGNSSAPQCYVAGNAGWRGANVSHNVTVVGQGGVPGSGVSAVVINVQSYAANSGGYLTVFPAGKAFPYSSYGSEINFLPSTPATNHVVVPVGSNGQISVYVGEASGFGTQVSISVDGWITDNSNASATGGLYNPNNGTLICATIANSGTPCSTHGVLAGGSALAVQITGQGGVPSVASAITGVELAITVTHESVGSGTFVCVYPSNGSCSQADLNLYNYSGMPVNLLVIVPVGPDGKVDVYTPTGTMDVLIAVTGYYVDQTQIVNSPNQPVSFATFTTNPSAYPVLDLQSAAYAATAASDKLSTAPIDGSAPEFTASTALGTATPNLAPLQTSSYYIPQANLHDPYHRVEENLGQMQPTAVRSSAILEYGATFDDSHFYVYGCKVFPCQESDTSAMLSAGAFLEGYVKNAAHLQGASFAVAVASNNSGSTDATLEYNNGIDWYDQLDAKVVNYASYFPLKNPVE